MPSERATITFQVRVINIPASGEIRNQGSATFNYQPDPNLPPVTKTETTPETTTPIQTVVISPTKTANLTFAEIDDIVTYTVTFTNQGTIPATGVTITDSLPPGTTFITNSVTVNNVAQPGVSPVTGIPVGTVNPGETVTVTFQIQINAIPPNGKIENTASITYTSQPNPSEPPITTTETTPTVTLPVRTANPNPQKQWIVSLQVLVIRSLIQLPFKIPVIYLQLMSLLQILSLLELHLSLVALRLMAFHNLI